MSVLDSLNSLSKAISGVGIVDIWQELQTTKVSCQEAARLAQNRRLREAVAMAETAIATWSGRKDWPHKLVIHTCLGNSLDELKQQLSQWRKQIAQANKLITNAQWTLQTDTGNPLDTQALAGAIAIYQRCDDIIEDEKVTKAIQQCQDELARRHQFKELMSAGESHAKKHYFKQAIAIYHQAGKLYPTEEIKQAIAAAMALVPQEEKYESALQRVKQAESEGRFRGAIALLETTITAFPRLDGIDLLKQLKAVVKGREQFRQGLQAEKNGDFPAAESFYRHAQKLLADTNDCQIRLGIVAIKTENWQEALAYLEGVTGEQAAYLRGLALARQGNLQLAYRQWQTVSDPIMVRQKETLRQVSQRQRLLLIQEIETSVHSGNLLQAQTLSTEFFQKFGVNPVIEANLYEHIQPRLAAEFWQNHDWETITEVTEKKWIEQPNITNLHNWAIATYFYVQNYPDKIFNLIIALPTALANIRKDPILQDIPWLGNQSIDYHLLYAEFKRRLETAVDEQKDIDIEVYLNLRDRLRLEWAALQLMMESSPSGMEINEIFLTPSCYSYFQSHWSNLEIQLNSQQRVLSALYTPWGMAIAACLTGDRERAMILKPMTNPTTEIETFAQNFVAYYEGCYYLQQQQWHHAVKFLQQAQGEIQLNPDWQRELDQLCLLQRAAIQDVSEHLSFAQVWYDIFSSQAASSYLAEYKAEAIRAQLVNKNIDLSNALEQLAAIKEIDANNPVLLDLIENLELSRELEEIERLFQQGEYEIMVKKAKNSRRDRVRYVVAEFFIDILINSITNSNLNEPQTAYQLGKWAYEICPDEPEFQDVYRSLRLR
ncbi:peptidase M, neutral zinc metallopeptidase site [Richelia sinica]|uniref:peptidase M, neutral zinc metallopeptidase site n=1 Tax=Richelia sinica TaxID=1357545 RepID=UPI0016844B3F|nr:peptidase M, neutral zinc metallopeptidase site [Richelia sinica]MBD2667102.1 peptidase M, neutral zinc metallopeptidase site [Richelia sinica FACHB-800]